jgi:hypothetical protein
MEFCGQWPVRSKLILDNQPIEQVSKFNYLGYQLSYQIELENRIQAAEMRFFR